MTVITRAFVQAWLVLAWVVSPMALADSAPDFANIVADVSPSVVNITTTTKTKPRSRDQAAQDDMQEFLRRFYGLDSQPAQPRVQQSFGSGFILTSDGYVLTNNHVIDGADTVMVRLSDRRELEAKVIGTDPRTDIALLKIAATGLPMVRIGDIAAVRVGDWVLAIGSPFGFDYSATAGIVSAKARALPSEAYVPFIQTDVAINPGNSGGPLFNGRGEVVGINSQIYSRSGGFMGLSFAIPMDVAMEVVGQLREHGKVTRGWLGVSIQEVTKDLADAYGLKKPAGALIASVEPNSPAAKAGLKAGDVVTAFNGQDITLSAELPQAVGRVAVNKAYALTVYRDRKVLALQVTIDAIPEDEAKSSEKAKSDQPDSSKFGVYLRDLSEQEKRRLKLDNGVLVVRVLPGAAADAGLQRGDVIVELSGQAITSAKNLVNALNKVTDGRSVPVRILRGGVSQILALKPNA